VRTPMLIQASNMYTACIFEAFQVEYERSLAAYARPMENLMSSLWGLRLWMEKP
jgi:hypothetical protein